MTTPAPSPCCPCPPPGTAAGLLLCDTAPDGTVTQFVRIYLEDGSTSDTAIGGGVYTPSTGGTVGQCSADQTDGCDTTTPVTAASLCLADGTPVVVVVQRDCAGTVSAPGWVNLTSGVYTAGAVPAGAGTCEQIAAADCDTTTAIATTGLCLADGTPVAVVTMRACDGTVTSPGWVDLTTNVFTAGTLPAGAGACDQVAAAACDQTTPITTTGLCLADGTPIATVAQRDCDGVVTQSGWLNLTTGAYSVGLPPAGTIACGAGQSIQVAGVFCDLDPTTGDVLALVLVEYHYDDTGAIESVRLVRADDGTTYTLAGTLSICPGGGASMDVEGELLCLVDAAGTLIQQVFAEFGYDSTTGNRLFVRFTDPLTGTVIAPPAGATVGSCAELCEQCETLVLCHTPPAPTTAALPIVATASDVPPIQQISGTPVNGDLATSQQIWDGDTTTVPPGTLLGQHTHYGATLAAGTPACGALDPAGDVEITVSLSATNDGPAGACATYGRLSLWNGGTTPVAAQMLDAGAATLFPVGSTVSPSITGTVPVAALTGGAVTIEFDLETGGDQGVGCNQTLADVKSWTVTGATIAATAAVTGCAAAEGTEFLRHVCRTCEGTVTTTDTLLDGVTPYDTSTGEVGLCSSSAAGGDPATCQDCEVLMLCDTTTASNVTLLDTPAVGTDPDTSMPLPGGGQALWDGGTLVFPAEPPDPAPAPPGPLAAHSIFRGVAATLQADGCATGDATVTVTATVHNDDPAGTTLPADFAFGLDVQDAGTTVDVIYTYDDPQAGPGESRTLTLTTTVPAASIAAGNVQVQMWVLTADTFAEHTWTASNASVTVEGCGLAAAEPVSTPFVRDYVRDAAGAITGHVDYTLDGTAVYAPTGEVGACMTTGTTETVVCETLRLCDQVTQTSPIGPFPPQNVGGGTLPNGVTWTRTNPGQAGFATRFSRATGNQTWTFDRMVDLRFDIRLSGTSSVQLPLGVGVIMPIAATHIWDPATRTLRGDGSATVGVTSFALSDVVEFTTSGTVGGSFPDIGNVDVTATTQVPFLRTTCRDNTGAVVSTTNTTLAGAVYVVAGTVVDCAAAPVEGALDRPWDTEVVPLCDAQPDGSVVEFIRVYAFDGRGVLAGIDNRRVSNPAATYVPTGTVQFCAGGGDTTGVEVVSSPACVVDNATGNVLQRIRQEIVYDSTGVVQAIRFVDAVSGAAVAIPGGASIAVCPNECVHCTERVVCDDGGLRTTNLVSGTVSTSTLPNGITWSVEGNADSWSADLSNADGSWWALGSFPNIQTTPGWWTFSHPVDVEFSVILRYNTLGGLQNQFQVPIGTEVVSLPPGYHYDGAAGIVSVDETVTDCDPLESPTRAEAARFRLRSVSAMLLRFLGGRVASCSTFDTYRMGSLDITPAGGKFLRTTCRDCAGEIVGTPTDTALDGVTEYAVLGEVVDCESECGDCQAVQVCVLPTVASELHFITNEANETGGQTDQVWSWSLESDQATWYPMYHSVPNSEWTLTDTHPTRKARWVAPHPNNDTNSNGQPGEGPSIEPVPINWVARATFDLPPDALPETIRIASTVIGADQRIISYRLNDGPWQDTGSGTGPAGNYKPPAYTFEATALPGARAGTNELFLRIQETVDGPSAGLMAHLIATYQIPDAERSWTRMVCCGDRVYYLDEAGTQVATLPEFWTVVPCGASDTTCEDGAAVVGVSPQMVDLTGGAAWSLAEHPLTQAVTVTNVGTVAAQVETAAGTATLHPGQTVTWAVEKDYELVLFGDLVVTAPGAALVSVAWTEAITEAVTP